MANIGKVCKAKSKEHRDGMAVVEFLMEQGGSTPLTNAEVALKLGFVTRKNGRIEEDVPRFYRARNHVKDRIWKDQTPCCAYRLHYREIKGKAHLALIDPTGNLGEHATAAIATLRGWMTREKQHQTESQRQMASFRALADHALERGDTNGFALCHHAIYDLKDYGTLKPPTLAELTAWVESLA